MQLVGQLLMQFNITTHSPSLLSSFPSKSRKFVENHNQQLKVIKGISVQAAFSKMDSTAYPLINLYCEDDLANYLIKNIMLEMSKTHAYFERLVNIIESGPANEVKVDYQRHKRNFSQLRNKIGYCAVLDGDFKDHIEYSSYFENPSEKVIFLYPYEAPEKFLVQSYLNKNPNAELSANFKHIDHHALFQAMVNNALATDESDARNKCYEAFKNSPEFTKHSVDISSFLIKVVTEFTELNDS